MDQQTYVPVRWLSQKSITPRLLTDADVTKAVGEPLVRLKTDANTQVFMLDVHGDVPSQLITIEPLPIETVYFYQRSRSFAAAILNHSLLLLRDSSVDEFDRGFFHLQRKTYLGVLTTYKI